MFLQVIVKPLDLYGLQFGEPNITKHRDDVVFNDIRVAGDCIGPDVGLGICIKPEVHPMPQSDIVIALPPLVVWTGILLNGFGQFSSSQWQPSVFQFGISFRTRQGQAPLGWLACL